MRIIFLFFVFLLSACATPKLTPSGEKVRIVEIEQIDGSLCKKLKNVVHVTEMKTGGASPRMVLADVKNKIGEISNANVGASRFNFAGVFSSSLGRHIPIGSRIMVVAYDCPQSTYNSLVPIKH